ncbi:5'-AMP-activated protein kinase subunit gamma-1 isoform X6 [Oopsacas minuta]|uniref:5'-AMP-activated protein kinase subunit gamma-1 isoform X6 n=1 Tax=Oopsacas minuta TaxID=111878 RepID=A0AAV7KKC3_9METZ|nr:5'-AMP-activated protein kinase subunit gamma-1 isoform X6 [Oopsacas minuta]
MYSQSPYFTPPVTPSLPLSNLHYLKSSNYSPKTGERCVSTVNLEDFVSDPHNLFLSTLSIFPSISIGSFSFGNPPSSITLLSNQNEIVFQTQDDGLFNIDLDNDNTFQHVQLTTVSKNSDNNVLLQLTNVFVFELMTTSNQIVILDSKLKLQSAIAVLILHNNSTAALWHNEKGIIYDLVSAVSLLSSLSKRVSKCSNTLTILQLSLCEVIPVPLDPSLNIIFCESNLFSACEIFLKNELAYAPVIDQETQSLCQILSLRNLLSVIYIELVSLQKESILLRTSVKQLGVISTIHGFSYSNTLLEIFQFLSTNDSIVPIITNQGLLVNTFSARDGIEILNEYPKINISRLSIQEALKMKFLGRNDFTTCSEDDSIFKIISYFIKAKPISIFVVDDFGCLRGVIRLLNLIKLLLVLFNQY